jgi:hypothetical protein
MKSFAEELLFIHELTFILVGVLVVSAIIITYKNNN